MEGFLRSLVIKGWKFWLKNGDLAYRAVKDDHTDEILATLRGNKVKLLEILEQRPEILDVSAVSEGQLSLWYDWQKNPADTSAHVTYATRILSRVDPQLLHDALNLVMARHEGLRSVFVLNQGELIQQTFPLGKGCAEFKEISENIYEDENLAELITKDHKTPFDLALRPAVRLNLYNLGDASNIMTLSFHHILIDGVSLGIVLEELISNYDQLRAGLEIESRPAKVTYKDFVYWQKDLIGSEKWSRMELYWRKALADAPTRLNLPEKNGTRGPGGKKSDSVIVDIPPALYRRLNDYSQRTSATTYNILLAAFQTILFRYSGQKDLLVGSPFLGRTNSRFSEVVGYFINAVVLRARFDDRMSFSALLSAAETQVYGAIENQDFQFSHLIEKLKPKRYSGTTPFFQAWFNLNKSRKFQALTKESGVNCSFMPALALSPYDIEGQEADFDLVLAMDDSDEELVGKLKFNSEKYDQRMIEDMAVDLVSVLDQALAKPDISLLDIYLVTDQRLAKANEMAANGLTVSPQQARMWALRKILPEKSVLIGVGISGETDESRLKEAVEAVFSTHEIFSTRFVEHPLLTAPLQTINNDNFSWAGPIQIPSSDTVPKLHEAWSLAKAQLENQAFDLLQQYSSGYVIRCKNDQILLVLEINPLYVDGTSIYALPNEIAIYYKELISGNALIIEEPVQYLDVSEWNNKFLCSEQSEPGKAFWRSQELALENIKPLRLDKLGLEIKKFSPKSSSSLIINKDLYRKLINFASERNVGDILFATWQILLNKLNENSISVIGRRFDGRPDDDSRSIVGPLARFLPIPLDLRREEISITELLEKNSTFFTAAEQFQDCFISPFDSGKNELSRAVPYVFEFDDLPDFCSLDSVYVARLPSSVDSELFNLKLSCQHHSAEHELKLSLHVNQHAFDIRTGRTMLGQYIELLSSILLNPATSIFEHELPAPLPYEPARSVDNRQPVTQSANSVIDVIIEQARSSPESIALRCRSETINYAELIGKAAYYSCELKELGVNRGDYVGVYVSRSNESVIAMLAIMLAGAVYVPLDPHYPLERLNFIIDDSGLSTLLLGSNQSGERLCGITNAVVMNFKAESSSAPVLDFGIDGHDAAYLIYTSGSTGRPKGVVVEHASLAAHCLDIIQHFDISVSDNVLCFAPFSFDPSIEQCIPALMCGATVQVKEDDLWQPSQVAEKIHEYGLTIVNLPTAFWHLLTREWGMSTISEKLGSLRLMVVGGDRIQLDVVRMWQSLGFKGVRLLNAYGPTETTITATFAEISESSDLPYSEVPIGKPLGNRRIYILDQGGTPVHAGVQGELFIGGSGVARGYLNRKELTEQVFLADPFAEDPDSFMYKTGDRAFYDLDGNIYFSGRVDSQVKIRGYRIELLEIEQVVKEIPHVREAVVVNCELASDTDSTQIAVCYSSEHNVEGEIKAHLKASLPKFMLPTIYLKVQDWPYGPAGKIDYSRLGRWAEGHRDSENVNEPPKTATEKALASIWRTILGVSNISRSDQFAQLGGHSLLFMKLLSRINEKFSVELKLGSVINTSDLAGLALLIDQKIVSEDPCSVPLVRIDRAMPIPLSYAQESLWLLSQLGQSQTYQMSGVLRFRKKLDLPVLQQCLNILLDRHEALRTCFEEKGGQVLQNIQRNVELEIEMIPVISREQEDEVLKAFQNHEFDLSEAPLMRVILLRSVSEGDCIGVSLHHIVSDGISTNILLSEMALLYNTLITGKSPDLAPLPIQFADYAAWQKKTLTQSVLDAELSYWKNQLEGYQDLDIFASQSRPVELSGAGRCASYRIPEGLNTAILTLAKSLSISQSAVLVSAVKLLLSRYSNTKDFCLGMPAASREKRETQDIVGMLVNVLVLRAGVHDLETSVDQYLKNIHQLIQRGLEHKDVPFDRIVGCLQPERDFSRNPVFQVLVSYIEFENVLQFAGEEISFEHLDSHHSRFDLSFDFGRDGHDTLTLDLEYSSDLFSPQYIEHLIQNLEFVLTQLTNGENGRLSALSYVAPAQVMQQNEWGRGAINNDVNPSKTNIIDLIDAQMMDNAYRPALTFQSDTLNYKEYLEYVTNLAGYLQSMTATSGVRIAICVRRSMNSSIAMLATLQLGAVYVPIDSSLPPGRISYILDDCEAQVIIVDEDTSSILTPIIKGQQHVVLLESAGGIRSGSDAPAPQRPRNLVAENAAYIIYTSGSTGNPKGVVVSLGALTYCMYAMRDVVAFKKEDKMLAVASTSFDISILDLLLPLCFGGELVIADDAATRDSEALSQLLISSSATIMQATPSTWEMLFEAGWQNPTRAKLLSIGEPISDKLHRSFEQHNCHVWNGYGPTEATIYTTAKLLTKGAKMSIGRAIPNYRVYILDNNLDPVPVGVPGELYIAGPGLAEGYLNKPEMTSRVFLSSSIDPGGRIYKSGDLVRWCAEDSTMEMEFLGRTDDQVKLRGYRIELGEIETALDKLGMFSQTAVLVLDTSLGAQLVAFLVMNRNHSPVGDAELKKMLSHSLPVYMIPVHFQYLDEMPMSPSRKLDKKALKKTAIEMGAETQISPEPPATETERDLLEIWCELFESDSIRASDNFFELGGHSLLMVRLQNRILAKLGLKLPLADLFLNPVLSQMANRVSEGDWAAVGRIEARSRADVSPLSINQQAIWLADKISGGTSAYNLVTAYQLRGDLNPEILLQAWRAVQLRHLALRSRFHFVDGESQLVISDSLTPLIEISELDHLTDIERKQRLNQYIDSELDYVFDLENEELSRLRLFKLGRRESVFVLNVHHIIIDGWSIRILLKELISCYEALSKGKKPSFEELHLQYTDFAYWQNQLVGKKAFKKQLEFWQKKLRHCSARPALPFDNASQEKVSYEGGVVSLDLDPAIVTELRGFAARNNTTLFNVMLSAWKILLHLETGETDILIGTDVAYRAQPELEALVGFFINQLPLRSKLNPDTTLKDFISEVTSTCIEAYSNQDVPFEKIVNALGNEGAMSQFPLFKSKFFMDSRQEEHIHSGTLEIVPIPIQRESARLPLNFSWLDRGSSVSGKLVYNIAMFEESTIDRLSRRFQLLCGNIVARAGDSISDFCELITNIEHEKEILAINQMKKKSIESFRRKSKRERQIL